MSDETDKPFDLADHVEPPPPVDPRNVPATTGARIAGALLIVNALFVIHEMITTPQAGTSLGGHGPGGGIAPIFDLVIGGALVAGKGRYQMLALVRCLLGLVVFGGLQLAQGHTFEAILQVLVSASFVALLVGKPGRARIAVGSTAFGLYAMVGLVGIYATATGHNPMAPLVAYTTYDVEPGDAHEMTGSAAAWRLTLPGDHWRLRTAASAKKDNALADRWAVWRAKDAHVMVIAEVGDTGAATAETVAATVIDNMRGAAKDFTLVDNVPLEGHAGARLVHVRGLVGGSSAEFLVAVVVTPKGVYQVLTFADPSRFADVEAEMRAILASFTPPAA